MTRATSARATTARATALFLLALALLAIPRPAPAAVTERIDITGASTVELALSFSSLIPDDGARTVLLGRDDVFADSLASGPLQSGTPLLLTPADELPADVADEMVRLGTTDVVIMGGPAAVSEGVESELAQTYDVRRVQGPSRIETALDAAAALPAATEALMVRAFADGDPTRAFADALAAGAWARAAGIPVLLSPTDGLHPATVQYLQLSAIRSVHLIGGEAALSAAVQTELEDLGLTVDRIAGATRFATATAIANARTDIATVTRVIVVEGQAADAWARGFPAAYFAEGSHVVLTNGASVPPETEALLAGSSFAQITDDVEVICAADGEACDQVVELLGGQGTAFTLTLDDTAADPGATVTGTVEGPVESLTSMDAEGCFGSLTGIEVGADGTFEVTVPAGAGAGPCEVAFTLTPETGDPEEVVVAFTVLGDYEIQLATQTSAPGATVNGGLIGDADAVTNLAVDGCVSDPMVALDAGAEFTIEIPGDAEEGDCPLTFTITREEGEPIVIELDFTIELDIETLTVVRQDEGAGTVVLFPGGSVASLDADTLSSVTVDGEPSDAAEFEGLASLGDEVELNANAQTANLIDRDATVRVETIPEWSEDKTAFEFTFADTRDTPLDTSGLSIDPADADAWTLFTQAGPVTISLGEFERSLAPGATVSVSQAANGTLTHTRSGGAYGIVREGAGPAFVMDYIGQNPTTLPAVDNTEDRLYVGSLAYSLFSLTDDVTEQPIGDFTSIRRAGQIVVRTPDPDGSGHVWTLRPIPIIGSVDNLDTTLDRFTVFDVGHPFFPVLAGPGQQGFGTYSTITYGSDQDVFSRGIDEWRYINGSLGAFETRVQTNDYVVIVPEQSKNGIISLDEV